MTVIFNTGTKPVVKVKRKPGHAQREADYKLWLAQYGNPKKKKSFTPYIPPTIMTRPDSSTSHIKSVGDGVGSAVIPAQPVYEGKMAEREREAQKEIAWKKTCVAPVCNKSNYIYITPGMDPTTLGRKI
jgi:hypothetical protein